jgi:hypothetical protein
MTSFLYTVAFVIGGVILLLVAALAIAALVLGFDQLRNRLWVRHTLDDSKRHRAHFCLLAAKKHLRR